MAWTVVGNCPKCGAPIFVKVEMERDEVTGGWIIKESDAPPEPVWTCFHNAETAKPNAN